MSNPHDIRPPTVGDSCGPFARCYECGRGYALGHDASGEPTLFHELPYCAAYEAVSTVADAVAYSERCRAATGGAIPPVEGPPS